MEIRCENCIHNEVCYQQEVTNNINEHLDEFGCENYKPTADVVPKSEAESLTLELNAMRGAANSYKMHYNNLAKEIFDKIDSIFRNQFDESSKKSELKLLEPLRQSERFVINEMWNEIAELKKKYTEEKL